jgi:hypothetical protein
MEQEIHSVDCHELGDIWLTKRIADKLNDHYPGHLWAVHLNDESLGGVVVIRNMALSGKYGFVLKLKRIYADPSLKCVMQAGGEMLERANMSRSSNWNNEFPDNIEGII